MSYHKDGWQGAGAIAASVPAPRSAPAPLMRARPRSGPRPLGMISSLTAAGAKCTVVNANGVCIQLMNTRAPTTRPMGGGNTQPPLPMPGGTLTSPTLTAPTTGGVTTGYGQGTLRPPLPLPAPGLPDALAPTLSTKAPAPSGPTVFVVSGGSAMPRPLPTPSTSSSDPFVQGITNEEIDSLYQPTPTAPQGMTQGKKVALIVGGVALAYYLYRRSRKK